jgi:hypothetical protein
MVEFAEHWREFDEERDKMPSSGIARFETGAIATETVPEDTEVTQIIIWRGTESESGAINIESHHRKTGPVPDNAEYLVECLTEDGAVRNEYFESNLEDAIQTAQMLTEGTLDRNVR